MESFSQRELEILGLLAKGLTNREIGQKLFISPETVKWYNKQLFAKLGASSRTQAVTIARQQGLFDEGQEETELPTAPAKHNLPAPVTTFIGRERQIAEVMDLLDKARLVTLTGPGGTGKTRLGQQVAAGVVERYPGGVTFVPLALVDRPELVPDTIAQALGVIERADEELVETLGRSLRGKEMLLLLLDNYEHVLAAAPLVSKLLAVAPGLSVMVTSREVLRLNGEHEYPVPPLEVPDLATSGSISELAASESVALFVQRAQAVQPSFHLAEDNAAAVAGICKRLDGLPLAIELAAARIKIFTPQQLLERLQSRLAMLTGGSRDLPARQQTLRSAIGWSYQLLNEGEQTLFARLGVFSAGRSIDAVEAVCGPGLPLDALDGLESLVNKSLLFQIEGPNREPRFAMLETIHEYARERLSQSGKRTLIRDRHLAYFLALAEEMEPDYRRNHLLLLERTEAEMGNFRLAINWAFEKADLEAGARLVSAISYFLYYRERFVEGYQWASRLLNYRDDMASETRIKLLIAAGNLASANREMAANARYCSEALVQARELGDRPSQAWALTFLGGASIGRPEEYAEGVEQAEAGLAIFRELGDQPGMAQALNILGELARTVGDYSRAREVYEECLVISQETGEKIRQAMSSGNLAFVAFHEGEFERARDLFVSFMMQMHEIGAKQWTSNGLAGLAGPLARLGEPIKAARLLGAADALIGGLGIDHQMGDEFEFVRYAAEVRSMMDETTFEAAFAEGQTMGLEEAVAYALEGVA